MLARRIFRGTEPAQDRFPFGEMEHARAAADPDGEFNPDSLGDYLERTGDLGDPEVASRFLLETVEQMVRKGERRRLLLSNYAIDAYRKFATERRCLVMVS